MSEHHEGISSWIEREKGTFLLREEMYDDTMLC